MEIKYLNNNYYSGWELVRCGVPQASVLELLLSRVQLDNHLTCKAHINLLLYKLSTRFSHVKTILYIKYL
jgi:hypothetical protein